jgi:hypothetical protein
MIFNISVNDFHRGYEVTTKLSASVNEYRNLREGLAELMHQPLGGNLPAFLHKARHLVWLIALGTLFKYAVTAFFYPFFFIFIIGLGGIWKRIKEDRRVLYLALSIALIVYSRIAYMDDVQSVFCDFYFFFFYFCRIWFGKDSPFH